MTDVSICFPIRQHKRPNATVFLDPGYYAGYPVNGVPSQPALRGFWHTGTDYNGPGAYDADQGNPCFAIRPGVIEWAGKGSGTWGNMIVERFEFRGRTYWARYGHVQYTGRGPTLSAPRAGRVVARGEVLAYIGKGGARNTAFPAHLHFDILHTKPPRWDWWPRAWAPQSEVTRYALDPDAFLRQAGAVEP